MYHTTEIVKEAAAKCNMMVEEIKQFGIDAMLDDSLRNLSRAQLAYEEGEMSPKELTEYEHKTKVAWGRVEMLLMRAKNELTELAG